MHFTEFLRQKGYQPFREDKNFDLVPCNDPMNFSSTMGGMTCTIWKKENSFFVYGLLEVGHAPTLTQPYYKGRYATNTEIEKWMKEKTNDEIFEELYPLSIKQ